MNKNAKSALDEYREKLKNGEVKKINTTPIDKLAKNPTSLRLAVTAMCFDCVGRTREAKDDIKNCTSPKCPLFNVRPYQEKGKE